jgi:CRISPR-associated protein Cmr2
MKFYVSFSLSPVQEFVSAARTTRDLWTGSFLLSWLTGHAILSVGRENLVLPSVADEDLLLDLIQRCRENPNGSVPKITDGAPWVPTIPNTFVAQVDKDFEVDSLRTAALDEWNRISGCVEQHLSSRTKNYGNGNCWAFWKMQVENYWEIHLNRVSVEQAQRSGRQFMPYLENDFQAGLKYTGRLAAASKQIRQFQPHEVYRDSSGQHLMEDTRPKCSMFASMAQMGPIAETGESQMELSRSFWEYCVRQTSIEGARLQPKDRLCAVALVKRFAYACYFQPQFKRHVDDAVLAPFSFPDIDTICSRTWLNRAQIEPEEGLNEHRKPYWSGRWLRWKSQREGEEAPASDGMDECPSDDTWAKIIGAKRANGSVPVYYAALMLDGDKMGETIARCNDARELCSVSSELGRFASKTAIEIVEKQFVGKLVYAGGDDVLALLPSENGLACADALRRAFANLQFPNAQGVNPSCTVAIVVAHYKHPLHAVLAKLRSTERFGKLHGGNCLALTVTRRSGEETTNKVEWDSQLESLSEFVQWFRQAPKDSSDDTPGSRKGETDRWVYRFRQALPVLADQDLAVHRTELARLLSKAQLELRQIAKDRFLQFFDSCSQEGVAMESSQRFAQLIQSASFIARNKER